MDAHKVFAVAVRAGRDGGVRGIRARGILYAYQHKQRQHGAQDCRHRECDTDAVVLRERVQGYR